MIHFPYEIKHWQQQQFWPDYGPNLLSQRCYLVSLEQQGCHVCPVWTAEGNRCLRNSMKKAVDFSLWTAWKSEGWREEWQPVALEAR